MVEKAGWLVVWFMTGDIYRRTGQTDRTDRTGQDRTDGENIGKLSDPER